jgi:integrase
VRYPCKNPLKPTDIAQQLRPAPCCIAYCLIDELEAMFKGRHFTPDGHTVGSIGEAIAAHHYFGPGDQPMTPQAAQHAFARAIEGSKWDGKTKSWHVLRHSFVSGLASKSVDQRIIDDFVGRQTEEQRRRYRHLYPSTQQEAIKQVFG